MTVIFGGSFDPPHNSHVEIASFAAALPNTDKLLVVPAYVAPHKAAAKAGFEDRLDMCRLAFAGIEKVSVSDIERTLGDKSYTVNTLKALQKDGPLALLMGADMAETLDRWYHADEIVQLCEIWAVSRDGRIDVSALERMGARYRVLELDPPGISSTEIRNNKREDAVLKPVEDYIKSHSLYGIDNSYKQVLRSRLSDKRYHHCLMVAAEAVRLAEKYGADVKKAYTAGLLHDITKDTPQNEQLKLIKEFGIIMTNLEKNSFKLWHAITGAYYIKNRLKIDDDDIFDAVRYHTTARADMPLLSKIIYLADYTSADRDYDGVSEMRRAVDEGIPTAMRIALEFTVDDLSGRGLEVHPDTLAALSECGNL